MRSGGDRERLLAAAAGDGDEAAFAQLVERHRDGLVRFVTCRSGRDDLAEDAVQEALVSAHRALRAGQRPADVRAWLHTIAWHRALDLVRRERETLPLESAELAAASAGPEPVVLRAGELDRIVGHWAALPRRQRDALVLSVFEGRSLQEIAGALDVTESAAKSLVARGRRTLVSRLAAPELTCEAARPQLLAAAERGVRLRGEVHRHVRGCRRCARLHLSARMRRRVRAVMLLPVGLLERGRDLVYVTTAHEPQVSLVTKLCATACAATLAGGGGAATVAVTGPQMPLITKIAPREPQAETRKADRRREAPERRPATAAATTPVVAATHAVPPATGQPSAAGGATETRSVAVIRPSRREKPPRGRPPGDPTAVTVVDGKRTTPQPLPASPTTPQETAGPDTSDQAATAPVAGS